MRTTPPPDRRTPPLLRRGSWQALVCLGLFTRGLLACDSELDRAIPQATAKPANITEQGSRAQLPASPSEKPQRLLSISGSAYAASLAADHESGYLLTSDAAYRFTPGGSPERWALTLGFSKGLLTGHLLYWSEGAFKRVPSGGGEPKVLAHVAREPERLVTSGDRVVWLDQGPDRRASLRTLDAGRVRVLCTPDGYVSTLAMAENLVYFVERASDQSWRFGIVPLSGGPPSYTSRKQGRTPAMLAIAHELFYYDGPSSTVRRVSLDLHQEQVLARDVICSPLAVAEQIYCAEPAGIVELALDGKTRRTIPLGQGPITALMATANELFWLTDIGGGKLAVDRLPIHPAPRGTTARDQLAESVRQARMRR